ncbi:IclR family transcriptional regulator [Pikeienuella piscinae]|uniref:IclR family transcriptional regulator n=1 Tax=Pikeienuella piscinae TaxID=2748098 RepID=A0A7L5BZJ9_9RHOB|nr:IclR family transcriptional regulator [Pikeienuella piscinae]QIE55029.1 IclR family transcriptional regulator [Pikeienuella piscinae]
MSGVVRQDGPMVLPRAFALLRLLAASPRGLSLSDIATRLDVPKSSLSSTLKALADQGYLARERALYSLGPQSFALASAILAGKTISQIARPSLEKAMEESGESVLLATLDPDGAHLTYVEIAESPNPVRYAVPVGTRRPLYATACGKLFLAERSEQARRAYYETTALEKKSDATVTDPEVLEGQLQVLRESGVSITFGEYSADAAGFAAPIRGAGGALAAALVIAAPITRGRREAERFARLSVAAAGEISGILGGASTEGREKPRA